MFVGHIQNIGSGAPRGTGSCCHQPALLTWASDTRLFSRSAPVAGGLLDPPALPLPHPPSKHFSAVPREVGPRANKFQNFQSPPGSNNNCDSLRLVIKNSMFPSGALGGTAHCLVFRREEPRTTDRLWTRKEWSTVPRVPAYLQIWAGLPCSHCSRTESYLPQPTASNLSNLKHLQVYKMGSEAESIDCSCRAPGVGTHHPHSS